MRAVRRYGFLIAVLAAPSLAQAQTSEPAPAAAPSAAAPVALPPEPDKPVAAPAESAEPGAPPPILDVPPVEAPPSKAVPVAVPEPAPASVLAPSAAPAALPPRDIAPAASASSARDFDALPLTLEVRFGFNARLGSSFDASSHEELFGTALAVGGYLAWSPEYALGLEVEHSGLGRVRGLSGQNSIDAEYGVSSAWVAARVFPIRRERLDVFVNLRLGLALQQVSALGTRVTSDSITVPATSFSCSESDGPGIGLGGAVGIAYRLARHVSFVSRVDATGERLSGDQLGTCADGIGSVASISGSLGLAYEFDTAPK